MSKKVTPLVITVGLVATGGFAAYRWLFKEPDHVSLWTAADALKFHRENGFHHPKLPRHIHKEAVKQHAEKAREAVRLSS